MQTCYTNPSTFDNYNNCELYTEYNYNGETKNFCNIYLGVSVRVDSLNNVSAVENELKNQGFEIYEYDHAVFNRSYYVIPLYISSCSLIVLIIIFILFIRKKCIYKKFNCALMQSQRFTNIAIIKIELLENTLLFLTSYIIGIILYVILQYILSKNLLSSFAFYGYPLSIPIIYIIFVYILFNIFICSLIILIVNKYLKKNIIVNLGA